MSKQGLLFGEEPLGRTLADARAEVLANREDGIECPCCDQFVKVYRRSITADSAAWLVLLVNAYRREPRYYHVGGLRGITQATGDRAKLRYWGLIEQRPKCDKADAGKRTSGYWKPTQQGMDYVDGNGTLPRHAYVVDGTVLGYSDERRDLQDCLGNRFDFGKLMRGEL